MNTGLLILRVLIGALVFGHASQKAFGAFGGMGPDGTAPVFESWGLSPGRPLVLLAAACELIGSTLLMLGLATPLGGAMIVGTLTVASSVFVANGLWAAKGGFELPLVYVIVAGSLTFIGPGKWSLDHTLDLTKHYGIASGLISVAVALLLAGAFIGYRRSHSQPAQA